MAVRQLKDFVGATTGDEYSDSLGNEYSPSIGVSRIQVYWTKSLSAGTLTYMGVTFDAPVLANALIAVLHYFNLSDVMTRQVLMEFGAVGTGGGDDGEDQDFYTTASATNHKHANSPVASTSVLPQVWIAANWSATDAVASTPAEFTACSFNDLRERAYYRIASTPLTNHTVPFTTADAEQIAALLVHFDNVAEPEALETEPDPVEVIDNAVICCDKKTAAVVKAGGGQGNGAKRVQTPTIGGAAVGCSGGGTVPTQADIVHSETWWN